MTSVIAKILSRAKSEVSVLADLSGHLYFVLDVAERARILGPKVYIQIAMK